MGPIGRHIRRSLGLAANSVCFLRDAPSSSLSEFDCLRYDVDGSPSVVCYRAIAQSAIEDYKREYKQRFAAIEAAYLARAERCSVSNGDAANGQSTMFPPILAPAGEHQINFVSSLGNTRPASAAAVHGFAIASPEVLRDGVSAFEYLTIFRSARPLEIKPGELHGKWRLTIDEDDSEVTEIERAFRKAGLASQIRTLEVGIRRDIQAPPFPQSASVTEPIASSIKVALIDEGFEEQDETDVESGTGAKGGDIMSAIKNRIPFGQQGLAAQFSRNEKATILMKLRGLACTHGDRGAIGAAVFQADGAPGVQTSFGRLGVYLFGVGACSRRIDPQRRFLNELLDDAKSTILAELPKQ